MTKIKWNDLGRKYIVKKGRKSMIVNQESSYNLNDDFND